MAEIATLGDPITCGSFIASGVPNVFYKGMPIATQEFPTTTGHGCFPGSVLIGPWSTSVFINGFPVALKEITQMMPHRCFIKKHGGVVAPPSSEVTGEIE